MFVQGTRQTKHLRGSSLFISARYGTTVGIEIDAYRALIKAS